MPQPTTTFSGQWLTAPDNLHGPGPLLGAVATGAALVGQNIGGYEDSGYGEALFFSAGNLSERRYLYADACGPAVTCYYVAAKPIPVSGESELLQLLDMETLKGALPYPVIVGCVRAAAKDITTLESQRQERHATAKLARRVASLLPTFSEADLGRLVGVSRIAWRAWTSARTAARRGKRQRLLRLERILALRAHIDPDTPPSLWLDTPVGVGVETTPAQLLAEGRDELVAILAARLSAPQMDERQRLAQPARISELLDRLPIDESLAARREIYADDDEDDAR